MSNLQKQEVKAVCLAVSFHTEELAHIGLHEKLMQCILAVPQKSKTRADCILLYTVPLGTLSQHQQMQDEA